MLKAEGVFHTLLADIPPSAVVSRRLAFVERLSDLRNSLFVADPAIRRPSRKI